VKAGVIGAPIAHSRSPVIHRAAYAHLGLDWQYEAMEVLSDGVVDFVKDLDSSWRGLSVTMPCKEAVVELGEPDEVVCALGVGNTVVFEEVPSNRHTTHIHNTDVSGFEMLLGGVLSTQPSSHVQVLGTGATARSAIYALSHMGLEEVNVRGRDDQKVAALADEATRWGIRVLGACDNPDVLISTVPSEVGLAWADRTHPGVVFDVLYDPWPTDVATWGQSLGAQVFTGLDLLAAQGVGQIRHMTGQSISFDILRQALDQ